MTTAELLLKIESLYWQKLSAKTGWGKNEAFVAYKDTVKDALMGFLPDVIKDYEVGGEQF